MYMYVQYVCMHACVCRFGNLMYPGKAFSPSYLGTYLVAHWAAIYPEDLKPPVYSNYI